MSYGLVIDILFGLLFLIFFVLWFRLRKTVNHYKTTYANIVNVDNEILKRKKELDDISKQIDDVKIQYNSHHQTYVSLKERLAIYEEGIEMSEVGVYTPHFDFDTSEIYKENITVIKQKQKDMIKSGEVVKIQTEWEINGSKAKGESYGKTSYLFGFTLI